MSEYEHLEEYINKYVILIFTDYGYPVTQGKLLFELLGGLREKELVIITKQGNFIEVDKADVNEIFTIIYKEKIPSKQLEEMLKQIDKVGKIILACIHNATPEVIKDKQKELIFKVNGMVKEYIHELNEVQSPEWFYFSKICIAASKGEKDDLKRNFVKLIKWLLSPIKIFSLIKHRIMTSFLDLDIDWQGLKEINEKDKENAKKYLNVILEKKSENYYCQKLVNLWFYLTGKNDLNIIDNNVTTSLSKKDLPYEKSILDLINELTNEIKENLEKKLQTLLKHVELEIENKNKSEKVPYIIDYLKNLDKMIKDEKERDINKFLNFNFHEWYLKLGDLLEELKSFLE